MSDVQEIIRHYAIKTGKTTGAFGRMSMQAKQLLQRYTKEQIIQTIDYVVDVRKVRMYSFTYIVVAIEETLAIFEKQELHKQLELEKVAYQASLSPSEVKTDVDSSERNKSKSSRFGKQSRFGAESNIDLSSQA